MRKRWIITLLIAIIVAYVGYNYIYQDHRNIESETAEFKMVSSEIADLFSKDVVSSEQKFLNKTIEVTGIISEINTNDLTLEDKVFCQFSEVIKTTIRKKNEVKIKGRVIGYDDLLEQVKMDQCTIIN